jgi:hypothetical protein
MYLKCCLWKVDYCNKRCNEYLANTPRNKALKHIYSPSLFGGLTLRHIPLQIHVLERVSPGHS